MKAWAGGMVLVAAAAFGSGCHAWHPVTLAPGAARSLPAGARVFRPTGERIELAHGRVTADSVVGTRPGRARDAADSRVALPRDSVAVVQEPRMSWERTLGLVGGVLLGAVLLVGLAAGVPL